MSDEIVPLERIHSLIVVLRGQRVILDRDLADLYGVTTKRLNEQVKRNGRKFPGFNSTGRKLPSWCVQGRNLRP
ncbi:MAG: ORF6N domain-containing protein [Opitutaceae bacterium]|jgi:hypothetical protein|nr:ORF6N domain-containing protein [Opitutaceae bacterium]